MRQRRVLATAALVFASVFAAARRTDAQPLTITHFAGSSGGPGWVDGSGAAAGFHRPAGIAVDASGNVYVADTGNHTLRKVSPDGTVTTLAGLASFPGSTDGKGSAARFNEPKGIALDGAGNLYVTDSGNHLIRKVSPAGVVSTIAGLAGFLGSADGTGAEARFYSPTGVAVDGSGNVYVADTQNWTVRRITPSGTVATLAGKFFGPAGIAVDDSGNLYVASLASVVWKVTPAGSVSTLAGRLLSDGSADGTGSDARFSDPEGIAVDRSGNVFVADTDNHTLRRINPSGVVSTLAGLAGFNGSTDGTGSAARFRSPSGVALGADGTLYVADTGGSTVRRVTPGGEVSTLAGTGAFGSDDGPAASARFSGPTGVAADGAGTLYVADTDSHTIRKIDPSGLVSTIAGRAGLSGATDGPGADARFYQPMGIAADRSGNVFVADTKNHTIRKIDASGVVSTLAGQAGVTGSDDGTGPAARFNEPLGVAVDGAGTVYVADLGNNAIRKISPGGVVSTMRTIFDPAAVAVDGAGYIYCSETSFFSIYKLRPDGSTADWAGGSGQGSKDGDAFWATFRSPSGLAANAAGTVYVADTGNHTIRAISPAWVVSTVAGLAGVPGGTDGTGSAARFTAPTGIAVDASGDVFIAERSSASIRRGTTAPVLADVATIDAPFGLTGQPRRLGTVPRTATRWLWEVVRRPSGSTATLSATGTRDPTFTPDVPDVYVFRVTASGDAGLPRVSTVSLTVRDASQSPSAPVVRLLPIVLDVSAGSAHYTTELALTNNSTALLPVSLRYTASIGSGKGSGTVTDLLAPGEQRRIGDVLSWLRTRGLAIPPPADEPQQGGTLVVSFDGAGAVDPSLVSVVARTAALTSAPQPVGRAGLAYSGPLEAEGSTSSLVIYGLRSTASDRTNLAVFSTSVEPVTVKVTICSGSGERRCVVFRDAETLPPFGWIQYGSGQILDGNGIDRGWAVVERTSATGSFGAYGVINDNGTNDGSFVLPARGGVVGSTLTVPVLVETDSFRSELTFANRSANQVTLSLSYVESLHPYLGTGGTALISLPPMTEYIYPEAIAFLRQSIAIGPKGETSYAGALRVTVYGTTLDNIFVGARTAAQSPPPAGGQFGLFTPCVYAGDEASDAAYIYGLRADPENRTNLAFVNAGSASDGPVDLRVEFYDGDNDGRRTVNSFLILGLGPGAWRQLDGILSSSSSSFGLTNAWVQVKRTSGTAPWIAYAVINDGANPGERTGDGAYVPMVK